MNLSQLKGWDNILGEILIYLFAPFAFLANKIIGSFIPSKNSICILKMLGGGSLLIAYPALLGIRNKYKTKCFILICTKEVKVYASLMGIFDEIYIIETQSIFALISSALKALKGALRSHFFLNIEMHSKLCAIYSLSSLSKERFGLFQSWNKWQKNYINNPIFYNSHSPIFVGYDQLAKKINAEPYDWELASKNFQESNGFIPISISDPTFLRVALAPFCSPLYREREFSAQEWVPILAKHLPINCKELVIMGGYSDIARATIVNELIESMFPSISIVNKVGMTTLGEVINEFQTIDKLITIDSGINHIARLLNIPVISFWGPSDPRLRLKNINKSNDNHFYHKISCSPCVHLIDHPPCNGDNICMKIHHQELSSRNPLWEIK